MRNYLLWSKDARGTHWWLALLAFGTCWIGAVANWRTQERDPGTAELLFFLFILPAVLLAAARGACAGLDGAGLTAPARPRQQQAGACGRHLPSREAPPPASG